MPVRADYDEPLESVGDSRQMGLSSLRPYSVLKQQVSAIHTDTDPVSRKGDHPMGGTNV